MIKRLKLFGVSGVQKKLIECKIDKNHDMVNFGMINDFVQYLRSERHQKQLYQQIHKNLNCENNVIKIKTLLLLHYLVKKTFNAKLIQFIEQQFILIQAKLSIKTTQQNQVKQVVKLQNQQKEYIQKNIIQFYVVYMKKFICYQQSYQFAKKQDDSGKKQPNINKFKEQSYFLQSMNHGFKILNLINYVLQSQQSFNKMGRYYLQHYQVVSLFVMYLSDLTIYNGFIKKLSKRIVKFINQLQPDKVKHSFLFLTEAQKISDRLYEFHYNRYYYSIIKKFILMPTFLTVQNQEFDKVVKEIKKVDKSLFLLVKQGKYSQQNSKLNQTCVTQPHRQKDTYDRNKTMMTEYSQRKQTNGTGSEWQNITRYIEQVQEIDQKQQYI